MTDALDIEIRRLPQFGSSIAEPLAAAITAELMAAGWMRSAPQGWDDKVTVAIDADGQVVGFIAWRIVKWAGEAFIPLGGVDQGVRGCGVYRRLFEDLVDQLRTDHPQITRIASGHHVDNQGSAAMHRALGRQVDSIGYVFELQSENAHG